MEQDFYRGRLEQRYGLQVLTPDDPGRAEIHRVIYEELCHGTIDDGSRARYVEIVDELAAHGAGGVILGCTEIGLLIGDEDVPVPTFDTARIHAVAAVERALDDQASETTTVDVPGNVDRRLILPIPEERSPPGRRPSRLWLQIRRTLGLEPSNPPVR